jgi:hypothetical protein
MMQWCSKTRKDLHRHVNSVYEPQASSRTISRLANDITSPGMKMDGYGAGD